MRAWSWVVVATWVLCMPGWARAQVDPDLQLLADQNATPPNVMILFDTSGSMQHISWHEDFDPKKFWDSGSPCSATVYTKSGTSGQCPGSGRTGDPCPDNETGSTYFGSPIPGLQSSGSSLAQVECKGSAFPSGCAGIPSPLGCSIDSNGDLDLTLPDVDRTNDVDPSDGSVIDEPNEWTFWSPNYVHWFMRQYASTGSFPNIPFETRKMAAKRVLKDLVNELNPTKPDGSVDQKVRFGLARFHTTGSSLIESANGGYVVERIADGNKATVLSTLRSSAISTPGYSRTPLSEALVDVGRYFVGSFPNPSGSTGLGSYSVYNRNDRTGTVPPSPIDPAVPCRDNYVIVVTDGAPTSDRNDHHGSAFSNTFGSDYDGDGNSNNAEDDNDTLDDVAAYLFREDLIADSVMPDQQKIVTYTIGFALDLPLLRDTAQNGDGQYFSAKTAGDLADQLRYSLEDIVLRNGSFTAAAVPTSRTALGQGFYTAYFEPKPRGQLFRGHLQAYRLTDTFDVVGTDGQSAIDPATGAFIEPRTTFFWDAALTTADPANHPRNLFYTRTPPGSRNAFTPANLSASDLGLTAADIPNYPQPSTGPFSTAEALADAIVGYVRGVDTFDDDRDGNTTEIRQTVLGDIFHSSPRIVGPPSLALIGEPGFGPLSDPSSFVSTYAQRDKVIYAGANDGMLHAFDAGQYITGDDPSTPSVTELGYYDLGTGVERFGYVPGLLVPALPKLKQIASKPFYVDGQVMVADAWLPSNNNDVTKNPAEWTTTLMVGMRNGGRGYLALDVTDPGATGGAHGPYPKLMFEFADPAEPLGRTWSTPVITRVRLQGGHAGDFCGVDDGDGALGPGGQGDCREEWVAIFGGGYLEQGDPNMPTDFLQDPTDPSWVPDSKAVFMVSLRTGKVLARASFTEVPEMKFSFPSDPAVLDLDFDGFADVVYIGDTGGQLWKWDISAVGDTDASGRVPLTTWPVGRVFVAPVAANGHYRSFFFSPAAAFSQGELVLAVGTSERTDLDYSTTGGDENHFYVFKDPAPTGVGAFPATPYGIADLTLLNGNGADPDTTDLGFYLVGQQDEKFASDTLIFAGLVITASFIPDLGSGTPLCEARGDATLYAFSLEDGTGFFTDPSGTDPDATRRLLVGSGLPATPGLSLSGDKATLVMQTSDGRIVKEDLPDQMVPPVELIFWEQEL